MDNEAPLLFDEVTQGGLELARDILCGFDRPLPPRTDKYSWFLAKAHVIAWYRHRIASSLSFSEQDKQGTPFGLDFDHYDSVGAFKESAKRAKFAIRRSASAMLQKLPAYRAEHNARLPALANLYRMTEETRLNAEVLSRQMVAYAKIADTYTTYLVVNGDQTTKFLRPEKIAERANATLVLGF